MSPRNSKTARQSKGKLNNEIIRAIIGFIGVVITAYLYYLGQIAPTQMVIEATQSKEIILTSIHLTSNVIDIKSTEIVLKLTETPSSSMDAGDAISLQITATAIANQALSIKSTQTAIILMPIFVRGVINPDFPSQSINVRSSAKLPDDNSNIVGSVRPGDQIIITGWTEAPWIWYQIDVPNRNITGAWISGTILMNDKIYESVVLDANIHELPASLFIRTEKNNTP